MKCSIIHYNLQINYDKYICFQIVITANYSEHPLNTVMPVTLLWIIHEFAH